MQVVQESCKSDVVEGLSALFDVDGTVIAHDSFRMLVRRAFWRQPWRLFLFVLIVPILVLTVLLPIERAFAKSATLWVITVGRSKRETVRFLRDSVRQQVATDLLVESASTIKRLCHRDIGVTFVTASALLWLRPLLYDLMPLHQRICIGSRLRFLLGGVVLNSRNCYGQEKLRRIELSSGHNKIWHSAWTDSPTDIPLLLLAPLRFVINPKARSIGKFLRHLDNDVYFCWYNAKSRKD